MELTYGYGQTPLDEDEKEGLLIKSISSIKELNEHEQLNIEQALLWTYTQPTSTNIILSEAYVKKLHKKMFSNVWSWAGQFRKSNKNIGVEWPEIPTQLRTLIENARYWVSNEVYQNEEIAIRFKYEIVKTHCFTNGNGRHSRIIADVLNESFGGNAFSWGASQNNPEEIRRIYIDALRTADRTGDLQPLIAFAKN